MSELSRRIGRTETIRKCRQLEMDLGDKRVRIPWEGTTPRALTKGARRLNLAHKPANASGVNQLEMFDGELEKLT